MPGSPSGAAMSSEPTTAFNPMTLPLRAQGLLVAVIETPRDSGNKVKFDPDLGVYRVDRTLPAGMTFPFDFGFVPRTVAADGDPLDIIVLLDAPAFPGCVVLARLIGVLEAEQRDAGQGRWVRNDRLVAVVGGENGHASLRSLRDVDPFLLDSIGAFFGKLSKMLNE